MKLRFLCLLLVLFVLATPAWAQSGGAYALVWSTTAGASATSAGGVYDVSGTAGQMTTGQAGSPTPNGYTLASGFWVGVQSWVAQFRMYLPLMIR